MKHIARGDLFRRIKLNRRRLRAKMYRAPFVFHQDSTWPGDWVGRCILGLASLYHAFEGHDSFQEDVLAQLREIIKALPQHVNAEGYFGDLVKPSAINEQQVSGSSWFLRGLIEYYRITGDEKILAEIRSIVDHFISAIAPAYAHYPLCRRDMGGVGGHIEGKVTDGWLTSSDIGCAFIMVDAMSQAYALLGEEELKAEIESVIQIFSSIDFVSLQCQTHAALSCARGILTFFQATGEKKYLELAESIFARYLQDGMTKDFANFNWFGREETWTEPCCIVDSFLLSSAFFDLTGDVHYLRLMNRIYLNAFRGAQRSNGGAGCNTCLSSDKTSMKAYLYEAFFCCTMRFAEGLRFVNERTILMKDGHPFLTILQPASFALDNGLGIEIKGDIYHRRKAKLSLTGVKEPTPLSLYVPSSVPFKIEGTSRYTYENEVLTLLIEDENPIEIYFTLIPHEEEGVHFVGDMILVRRAVAGQEEAFYVENATYHYLLDYSSLSDKTLVMNLVQTL